ncbi:dihydrolipoamide acetyltransferase [Marinomonas primoryensis]|uniref:Dihydrolipoamide acetyltransferase component of pyruvate dehydrogenase complex n=1 Tax=Marinomonas primoryensis TaxID=178399 RepID=A0A2Z4PRG5_9GAMM|nr:2-oxo acid dehydrogenase subunit E2 [Marinomonas primoryensis]AWY00132.1 dihydrolipoamide acetyltransferase [Marinomonas primoryensis]
MKIDFILPDIGEGIIECELVDWHIQEGMQIVEDQSVADVMTDKALVEITSMYTGRISKLYYAKGEIAKVHQPLFEIEVASATPAQEQATDELAATDAASQDLAEEQQAESVNRASDSAPCPLLAQSGKAIASPAVRRLARECNIELSQVAGSGKNGRVMKEDLSAAPSQTAASHSLSLVPPSDKTAASMSSDRSEPIKGIRAVMAKQMTQAVQQIPHFTYMEELDLTRLDALRIELKAEFAAHGAKLSMLPFFMKALALTLPHFPLLNSRVNETCSELTYLSEINIGMAADTPLGLLVPNVKGVQHLSLLELSLEINRLASAAREGKLAPNEMKGGTITLSNIGALGGTVATPIINQPEVAIVALGRMQTLPRFNADGQVEARKIIQVSWSGDHRIIDGATMARFCNHWKAYLENPLTMLTQLR